MEKKQYDLCIKILDRFHVPEKGRGEDKPYEISKLGINAVALRFLSFLFANTIRVRVKDYYVTLPHPANYALHKLIIFQRRAKEEKAVKDKNTALTVLRAMIEKGEGRIIRKTFGSIPKKWQDKIIDGLDQTDEADILKLITS